MKSVSKFILIVLTTVSAISVYAQQDAQFSMYMFNGMAINPAYAGSRERVALTALYRHQWAGFEGAPKTFTFTAHAPVLNDRIGIGGGITSDNIGVMNLISFNSNYAYRVKFKNETKLAMGISVTFNNFRQRFSEITAGNEGDPNFAQNLSVWSPNFGTGVYYYGEKFYVGASIPHLINSNLNKSFQFSGTEAVARQWRHYFFTGGYVFDLGENFKLKPSVLVKYVNNAPVSVDGNLGLLIKEVLWLGASYRHKDAVIGMIEYNFLNSFRLGYAYDFTTSDLGRYTSGTHEIMLGYEFKKKDAYLTPRRMTYF